MSSGTLENLNFLTNVMMFQSILFIIIIAILLFIGVSIIWAYLDNKKDQSKNDFMDKAHILQDKGEYEELLKYSNKRLETYKECATAKWFKARALYNLNMFSEALSEFSEIQNIDPSFMHSETQIFIEEIKEKLNGPKKTIP